MRAIDLLSIYKGKKFFLLDKNGWFGRPWDTPHLIESVEEIRESVIRIAIAGKIIEFFAKPHYNIKIFGDCGFSFFDIQEGNEVILFSFISGNRKLPYLESDRENIIACMHDISIKLIEELKSNQS